MKRFFVRWRETKNKFNNPCVGGTSEFDTYQGVKNYIKRRMKISVEISIYDRKTDIVHNKATGSLEFRRIKK